MRIRKQINNLKIKFSETYNKYQVETPDKKVLEEFDTLEKAEEFARDTKDFRKKQKMNDINDIDVLCNKVDVLCNKVNEKYSLSINEVGSIEHHKDMCENAIVQVANENRGIIQLVYGEDKVLINYLRGILEDRIELKINSKYNKVVK